MTRYDDAFGFWVIALVATLIEGISQEDAPNRAWRELVGCGGFSVGITKTTKDA
jgi:hypothetical protein